MSESDKEAIIDYLKEHIRISLHSNTHINIDYDGIMNEKIINIEIDLFFDSELITSGSTSVSIK
jgi:hypothetical protein